MTTEGDDDGLLAGVRRTLERAGFDLNPGPDGLRLCREADGVVVRWEPGVGLDPAGHGAELEGMRSALRFALTAILTQAGYAVQAGSGTGEVKIRRRS